MRQGAQRVWTGLIYGAAALGGAWLLLRFLLPWTAPLLLSFGLAALTEPLVRALVRRGWRRGLAAGLVILALLALLIWGLSALTARGIAALSDFAERVPALMTGLATSLGRLEERMLSMISQAPEELESTLRLALDAVGQSLYVLPADLSRWALDAVRALALRSPDLLLFLVTMGIGSYFCSASFPKLLAFLSAQVPEELKRRFAGMGADLKGSLSGWVRAQLILMGITFAELLAAFLLLGIRSAVALAALTAFVDALPLFGTGIILAPWGMFCLLLGEFSRGLGLLIAWAAVSLVRSCIEAKLLGDQIGLHPLASLTAMYVGWRVWSVWGMLLFPVLLVTLQQLNDRGMIRLWKRV
ncbi:MAG: AI-2E family transporter [Oscillospiraceae bacterium]|nr:AI-2E family transporter [Oscillospiraceae bacterium]